MDEHMIKWMAEQEKINIEGAKLFKALNAKIDLLEKELESVQEDYDGIFKTHTKQINFIMENSYDACSCDTDADGYSSKRNTLKELYSKE